MIEGKNNYEITKLARIMFERQITGKWLSEKSGISQHTLLLLRKGKKDNVSMQTLSKIASALEVEIIDIYTF